MSIEAPYLKALTNLSLFSSFTQSELAQLFKTKYKVKTYGKGQIVHMQNEMCTAMGVILKGRVSIQRIDENGNVLKIAAFSNGDILGANLLFVSTNQYPYTVIADTETTVVHIYKELILELGQINIKFLCALMTVISDRALVLTDKINAISMKTIRQRITEVLKYEYCLQGQNPIQLHTSKKELAERLGIQRTSLSRELNKMRNDGLLDYDSKTVRLIRILE